MKSGHLMNALLGIYIFIFFTYLFGPLLIMSVIAFNSAEFPSITPWECFSWRWFNEGKIAYDGQKLAGLATDWRLHDGFISSLIIGIGVVILSVPIVDGIGNIIFDASIGLIEKPVFLLSVSDK